eukprot:gnl/TRDRNA2_/TRDRNA2_163256_c2_seq1.p1 gnl/TRDRNA2_/TRDRNA2_163256_c2~~gnl/TRDRNA2_/TRDRNA2_163256_c2_seq1.p1  ORF type:complete len:117 (-),score=2.55 gnl/TRDRNA2_/TRDRNA2_163256_c2_seq1:187-537(-)
MITDGPQTLQVGIQLLKSGGFSTNRILSDALDIIQLVMALTELHRTCSRQSCADAMWNKQDRTMQGSPWQREVSDEQTHRLSCIRLPCWRALLGRIHCLCFRPLELTSSSHLCVHS